VRKAEANFRGAQKLARATPALHDLVCFHCPQCAERYFKALLEELGVAVAKTHDLDRLLTALQPHHPDLRLLKRGAAFLTRFAVDTRHPGGWATKRHAEAALRWTDKTRTAARALLGLRRQQTP
jgi:HEPN domain-containing protein